MRTRYCVLTYYLYYKNENTRVECVSRGMFPDYSFMFRIVVHVCVPTRTMFRRFDTDLILHILYIIIVINYSRFGNKSSEPAATEDDFLDPTCV